MSRFLNRLLNRHAALLFSTFWSVATLALVAVTWPLWFCARDGLFDDGTAVPTISLLPRGLVAWQNAAAIVPAAAVVLVASLITIAFASWSALRTKELNNNESLRFDSRVRWCWLIVVITLAVLFCLDNLTLQPWAYQTSLFALVLAFAPLEKQSRWLRMIVISIYAFSAAGKIDYQFAHTVGRDMLDAIGALLHLSDDLMVDSTKAKLALLFPFSELALAIGLAWRRSRSVAAVLAILMHLSLILILGPWSLDHSTGVLFWNAALMVQAWLLFFRQPSSEKISATADVKSNSQSESLPSSGDRILHEGAAWQFVRWVLLLVTLAPVTERSRLWDHWTSWSLYAPHTSRVQIEIHQSAIDKLPETIRSFVKPDRDDDRWHDLAIEEWYLKSKRVPVYPQARYQLAVADRMAERYELGNSIRAIQRGVSNRWDGTRDEFRMLGSREIHERTSEFLLSR